MHTNLFAHINCLFKCMNCTFCMHFPVWFIGCLSCSFDLHIWTLFSTRSSAGSYRQCLCVCAKKTIGKMHLTYSCEKWSGFVFTHDDTKCLQENSSTDHFTDGFKANIQDQNAFNASKSFFGVFSRCIFIYGLLSGVHTAHWWYGAK